MCRQAGAICSPPGPRSNQSVSGGGAWLISHPSSLPSLVPKTDAVGNKANQYTSSRTSPAPSPKTLPAVCHQECHLFLSGITILFTCWSCTPHIPRTHTCTNKHKENTGDIHTVRTHIIRTPPCRHTNQTTHTH